MGKLERPFVTIIIPILNDYEALRETLQAIRKQNESKFADTEVIVIDNGSDFHELEKLQRIEDIILLEEKKHKGSPYSARNRGLEIAKGEIVILLDATCTPVARWLKSGLECLDKSGADLIGGNVTFDFEDKATASKIIDSVTSIRMKEVIEERNVAKTANLFIKKEVFDKVGFFPEGIRSGGDVRWTGKATSMGMKLLFCEEAEVRKRARGFRSLIKKKWRTGKAMPINWRETLEYESSLKILYKTFRPPGPNRIKRMLQNAGQKVTFRAVINTWTVFYVLSMAHEAAKLYGKWTLTKWENN